MGERQFLKNVGSLDDIKQGWWNFNKIFNRFTKNLVDIDQVVSDEEVVRAFITGLGTRNTTFNDIICVIPIYNPEEMMKSYVGLERSKDGWNPHKKEKKDHF